jgi:hypothetical protein
MGEEILAEFPGDFDPAVALEVVELQKSVFVLEGPLFRPSLAARSEGASK